MGAQKATGLDLRREALRAVLFAYGVGHLVTATLFLGWPRHFLEGRGDVPPWPLSLFQFGAWPPTHTGFMNVLGVYDVAVAVALFIAAWEPMRRGGIIAFVSVLWVGHGAAHAAHILWGTSPTVYWWTVIELWVGTLLVLGLWTLNRRAVVEAAGT